MKKVRLLLSCILFLIFLQGCSKEKTTIETTTTILETSTIQTTTTENDLLLDYEVNESHVEEIIQYLISEELGGRLTGTVGNELTIQYIKEKFSEFGLQSPDGIQNYEQTYSQRVRNIIEMPELELIYPDGNIKSFELIYEFGIMTHMPDSKLVGEVTTGMVYVDKYQSNFIEDNIKDKFVVVSLEMVSNYGNLYNFQQKILSSEGIILELSDFGKPGYPYNNIPVGPNVLSYTSVDNENGHLIFKMTPDAYKVVVDGIELGAKVHVKANSTIEEVDTANVIGYLPGVCDEYLIISAHLDHIGSIGNNLYNPGALDNGSGIAALLEIARYLSINPEITDKNVVFIAFNGEEEGLYGSTYYVEHPIFSLSNSTVINIDMLGSRTEMPLTINYCNNGSDNFSYSIQNIATLYGFDTELHTSSNSDHGPFCQVGTKAITLINMDLTNGYHTPGDTIDKVDIEKLSDMIDIIIAYIDSF